MKLIDKDAVVAVIDEIVRGLQKNCNPNPMGNMYECLAAAQIEVVNLIKDSLDTLEVKEVDLEKEFYDFLDTLIGKDNGHLSEDELFSIAKHFFELGMQQSKNYNNNEG